MTQTIEPIRRTVTVRCGIEEAFRVFTEELDTWWPLETHAIAVDEHTGVKVDRIEFEPRVGGHVIEHASSGETLHWAEVLVWEPPVRVTLAWKPNTTPAPPTEVEVRFTPEGEQTRVELEHRGWERLGDLAAVARAEYASPTGWVSVLGRYEHVASGEIR